jgi:hypothetical protein
MSPYLERVLVKDVEGVTGEPGTTTAVAVNQVGVLVACTEFAMSQNSKRTHKKVPS